MAFGTERGGNDASGGETAGGAGGDVGEEQEVGKQGRWQQLREVTGHLRAIIMIHFAAPGEHQQVC